MLLKLCFMLLLLMYFHSLLFAQLLLSYHNNTSANRNPNVFYFMFSFDVIFKTLVICLYDAIFILLCLTKDTLYCCGLELKIHRRTEIRIVIIFCCFFIQMIFIFSAFLTVGLELTTAVFIQ